MCLHTRNSAQKIVKHDVFMMYAVGKTIVKHDNFMLYTVGKTSDR